jgi:hypothetical protein
MQFNNPQQKMKRKKHMKTIILKTILTLGAIVALLPIETNAAAGDLYVSDNNRIWKITKPGSTSQAISVFADLNNSFGGAYPRIRGLAFDSAGNLYGSTLDTSTGFDNQGRILKFAPNGTFTVFATGLTLPSGIAFDSTGNLLVAGNVGTVYKITPVGTVSTVTTIGPGDINSPFVVQVFGIVFDKAGNLCVAGVNTIFRITDCGAVYFAFGFINFPNGGLVGVALDSLGNLYASSFGDGKIIKFAPDGATQSSFGDLSALDTDLRDLAFDSKGNLFVAGHGTNAVYEITSKGAIVTVANASTMPAPGFNVPQFLAFSPK